MAGNGGDATPSLAWLIVEGLTALVTAIVGFIAVRLHNRVDALEKQAVEDAKVLVTREELQTYIAQATEDRKAMHSENKDLLKAIFAKLDDHSELKEKTRRNEQDIRELTNQVNNMNVRRGPPPG